MMYYQLISIFAGLGLIIAAVAAFTRFRSPSSSPKVILRVSAGVAVALTIAYLGREIARDGLVEALQNSFSSAIVLTTLIALMGIGVHLASHLRGMDGFLFAVAAVFGLSSLTVHPQGDRTIMDQPWFVSHTLAFAISLACFVVSGVAGLGYLLLYRALRKKRSSALIGLIAPLESLERLGRLTLMIGFPLFTYGLLTGLCGIAHDEIEGHRLTLANPFVIYSLLAFLLYAVMIGCIWFVPRIRGRLAAGLAIGGMSLLVIGLVAVEIAAPLH
jgi:ABC-type uncharacterized transport system permease subunit